MTRRRLRAAGLMMMVSLVAGGTALVGPPASAATRALSIRASDDAHTSSARRGYNTGRATKLEVGRSGSDSRVTYLKFTVGRLARGTSVAGAQLRLVTDGRAVPGTLTLTRVSTSWTEKSLTAARAPKRVAAVASVKPRSGSRVVTFDVGRVVKGPGVYAFAVTSSARSGVGRFLSVEYGRPGSGGPELRLTLRVPAPTPPKPTTPAPTPTTPSPSPSPSVTPPAASPACTTGALLVPSCGVLWGAAAGAFTTTPKDVALRNWESVTGRTATIFHAYHRGDELFPTSAEIAMTRDAERPRTLLLNWKVAEGGTWAQVASGGFDARIDRLAAYITANFPDPFFLALHHEPENDVVATPGSGMTAQDYAAMYRHVVHRLTAKGVTNAVNVVAYMGYEKWMAQSWWADLYPGDDVVDWIGLDTYVNAVPGDFHYGDFASALDRGPTPGGTGFYDWATRNHAGKPIMVAEWGVYHPADTTAPKAAIYDSVAPELKRRPAIKALVYFDAVKDQVGDRNISVESTVEGLEAFRRLAADPMFDVRLR